MLRSVVILALLLSVLTLVLPASIGSVEPAAAPTPSVPEGADSLPVKVYFPDSDQVKVMPLGDYLKGVVAAEMPASFAMEALKAQVVVARTYTVRRMRQFGGKGGCPLHPEADVCADFRTSQAYIDLNGLVEKYGQAAADRLWRQLSQAQTETEGEVLIHRGELIDALYHAVSGRATENAGDYFPNPLPYLVSVEDTWGADSPKLVTETRFKPEEFARALERDGRTPVLAVTAATRAGRSPVQVTARTASGRVKTVAVGDMSMSGREFRERLGLRSTDFRVYLQGDELVVETYGDGHGVGMSQYGADGMARAGKDYTEILSHYYTGVSLIRLFEQ